MFFLEYTIIELIVWDKINRVSIIDKLRRQIYIVDNLKTNLLIDLDILGSKQIIVDYKRKLLTIDNYRDITISITITPSKDRVKRVVKAHQAIIVLSYFTIIVPIQLRGKTKLLIDRDLIFMLLHNIKRFESKDNILSYIINANMCVVQVNNTSNCAIIIAKNLRLDIIQNYKEEKYYTISSNYDCLVAKS